MTDAMNFQSFPQPEDGVPAIEPGAPTRGPLVSNHEAVGHVIEIGGSGASSRDFRAQADRAWRPSRSLDRDVGPGRQPDQDRLRAALAARQCPPAQGHRRRGRPHHCRDRFPGRGRRGPADRQIGQFQARHHFLSDPRQQGLPGLRRRSEADVRRRRARQYRDRHRLSDQGRARRALRRCPARQAFRLAGLDRHRQIDRRRLDHAPDLRSEPRGPYRDDRSARRIFGRVQGPWRIVQRRQSGDALLADELRGALRGVRHLAGRRAAARHRHPRQMPAPVARQEPRRGGALQAHRRFAHPLHALRSHQCDQLGNGAAQQGDRHRALSCASRPRSTN